MILLLVAVGLWAMLSGPAFEDWRARARARREFPVAKVVFLLPSECRGQSALHEVWATARRQPARFWGRCGCPTCWNRLLNPPG